MTPEDVVAALDKLTGDNPEADHAAADDLLLQATTAEVSAAYRRLVDRCPWWATS